MTPVPIEEIERRAAAGDVQAQRLLLQWLRDVAAKGNRDARRALGQVLLTRPPYGIAEGVAATLVAADAGDGEAAHLASILAGSGIGMAQDWLAAIRYAQAAAESGNRVAQAALVALSRDPELALSVESGAESSPDVWRRLAGSADFAPWLEIPHASVLSQSPRIGTIAGFAPPALCEWLIARARPRMERAEVIDSQADTLRADDVRTGSAMNFGLMASDLLLVLLRTRMAAVLGRSVTEMEPTAILHYAPGEHYGRHFDFLDPGLPGPARDVAARGQRVATFLITLSDGFDGGETEFPALGIRYKGRKGDALFFWNVDEAGAPDRRTLHAGSPPRSGEKWLLSQWVRDRDGALFGPVLPG